MFESSQEMQKRYPAWKKIDQVLTAYVDVKDAEQAIKDADDRKPVAVVVPISYATLEVLLTYFTSVFLETPYFKYEGVDANDVVPAQLLEKVIELQCLRKKVGLNLHTMFRDSLAYGFGAVSPLWTTDRAMKTVYKEESFLSSLFSSFTGRGTKQRTQEESIVYEGNMLKNIDPYRYLPDPSVPIHETQSGEYVGWIETTSYIKMLNMELYSRGDIFNVKYLAESQGGMYSQFNKSISDSGRGTKWGTGQAYNSSETRPLDVTWMYVDLIPKEWKLGNSESPEKWLFGVAYDKIIISAKRLGLDHNMFPVAVSAPDFDGHSVTPISKLELVYGLQHALNWLFDSHIANVRKSLNDMLIVDPSLININDLKDPEPGKLIRMRRAAWGRGVENAVKQLRVDDVTKGHISDSSNLMDIIAQIAGSVDSIQGVIRKTAERITAEEVRGTRSSAISRLARAAKVTSMQAMFDIGYMFASHTQQLATQEQWVRITGDWESEVRKAFPGQDRVKVTPEQLSASYDMVMRDGTTQGGEYVEVWTDILKTLLTTTNPALAQTFDVPRIFAHVARLTGAKDISQFIVRPQGQIDQGVQAGNLVPARQAGVNVEPGMMSGGGGNV